MNVFYKVNPKSDKIYQLFITTGSCDDPIPKATKQTLQQNYNYVCDLLTQCDSIDAHRLHVRLQDDDTISYICYKQRLCPEYTTKAAVELLVNAILNGNAYQYDMFKKYSIKCCPVIAEYFFFKN